MRRDPSDPYHFVPPASPGAAGPAADADGRQPLFTIFTVILLLFALVSAWQIADQIGANADEASQTVAVTAAKQVELDYVARGPDGRLVDTTILEVAQEANRTENHAMKPEAAYQPLAFVPGSGESGLGATFEQRLIGKVVGQRVGFTLQPGAGVPDWEKQVQIPRIDGPYPFDYEVTVGPAQGLDLSRLEQSVGPLSDGATLHLPWEPTPWEQEIVEVNRPNGTLRYRHDVTTGYAFEVGLFRGNVEVIVDHDPDRLTYRLNPQPDSVFAIRASPGGTVLGLEPGSYRVDELRPDVVVLSHSSAENPFLVGEPITFTVLIRDVTGGTP